MKAFDFRIWTRIGGFASALELFSGHREEFSIVSMTKLSAELIVTLPRVTSGQSSQALLTVAMKMRSRIAAATYTRTRTACVHSHISSYSPAFIVNSVIFYTNNLN